MITPVLKLSEIKKDPVCLLGWDRPAMITKYGDVVAYVVSPERMAELLEAERELQNSKSDLVKNVNNAINEAYNLINVKTTK